MHLKKTLHKNKIRNHLKILCMLSKKIFFFYLSTSTISPRLGNRGHVLEWFLVRDLCPHQLIHLFRHLIGEIVDPIADLTLSKHLYLAHLGHFLVWIPGRSFIAASSHHRFFLTHHYVFQHSLRYFHLERRIFLQVFELTKFND